MPYEVTSLLTGQEKKKSPANPMTLRVEAHRTSKKEEETTTLHDL